MKTFTKEVQELRLQIRHDDMAESPRLYDDVLGYFVTKERNRFSPDMGMEAEDIVVSTGEEANSQQEHMDMIKAAIEKTGEKVQAIYPIVKYEHGGVKYMLSARQGFDYSNCGFYIVTDKTNVMDEPKAEFEKIIQAELDLFNAWVNGEIYRFTLFNEDGEETDSCGGFVNIEDIRAHLPKDWSSEKLEDYIV